MRHTDVVIIGGGQAGLAMSRVLSGRGLEHVVLERGRLAERWRSESWDSLELLTPSWQSRLPGWSYRGPDPDGFMTASELVGYLEAYGRSFDVPLEEETAVRAVEAIDAGYRVVTDRGSFQAPCVVLATGHAMRPNVPALARGLHGDVAQLATPRYKNPRELPPGGVLIVGASASGVQLAEEIRASGRPVTLAVGRHTRLPRRYRGRDIMWWLDRAGFLGESTAAAVDLEASRRQPSLQLVGRSDHRSLDLATLEHRGVQLVGRVMHMDGHAVSFADDLVQTTGAADAKLARILSRIDRHIATSGQRSGAPDRPAPFIARPAATALDLQASNITTVLWATGFRRHYPWLKLPIFDARGELRHDGGVIAPGLYALGLNFMRRRNSSYLDGVGDDAEALAEHIATHLGAPHSAAA